MIDNKLNSNKEKKLNAMKSEILEIKEFVTSNKKVDDVKTYIDMEDKIDSKDTLTLTNIVNSNQKIRTNDNLAEIKNELHILRSM